MFGDSPIDYCDHVGQRRVVRDGKTFCACGTLLEPNRPVTVEMLETALAAAACKTSDALKLHLRGIEEMLKQDPPWLGGLARVRRYGANSDTSTEDKARASHLFHKLWGDSKDTSAYNKQLWTELQACLFRMGIEL